MVTENVAAAKNTEKLIWFHGEAETAFSGGAVGDLRPAFACLRPGAERNGNKTNMLLVLKRCNVVSL